MKKLNSNYISVYVIFILLSLSVWYIITFCLVHYHFLFGTLSLSVWYIITFCLVHEHEFNAALNKLVVFSL